MTVTASSFGAHVFAWEQASCMIGITGCMLLIVAVAVNNLILISGVPGTEHEHLGSFDLGGMNIVFRYRHTHTDNDTLSTTT
jgi:hypothetical protein